MLEYLIDLIQRFSNRGRIVINEVLEDIRNKNTINIEQFSKRKDKINFAKQKLNN